MKCKKAPVEKASNGTLLAAWARAGGNKWTNAEREKLGEQFMKLYYGGDDPLYRFHRLACKSAKPLSDRQIDRLAERG